MSQAFETISIKSDDEPNDIISQSMTSAEQEKLNKEEEVERLKHQSEIEVKLKHYESECHRFGLQKIKIVQRCLQEKVEVCDISEYGVGTLQCQIMFESISKVPETSLKSINMTNNHLEPFGCHAISSYMKISESLKELNLESCKFGDEGVKILAEGIAKSISINHLNVSNCCISDIGGEVLVKSFLVNVACEDLVMSSNYFALKTSKALQEVLTTNRTLKSLDLSNNLFYEDNAVVNILQGLMRNQQLEALDLSWNALSGEKFALFLSKSIKSSKLKILKMNFNRMASLELTKLATGLKLSKTIKEVYLEGNFLNGEDRNLLNVFNSKSPLDLISFGKWFHLSQDAFKLLQDIHRLKPFAKVIYENVLLPNPPSEVNMLDIYADRIKFLAMSPKKEFLKKDMSVFMTQLKRQENAFLARSHLQKMLKGFKVKKVGSLMEKYFDGFNVPNDGQMRVNIHLMADHYLNRHPYTTPNIFVKLN